MTSDEANGMSVSHHRSHLGSTVLKPGVWPARGTSCSDATWRAEPCYKSIKAFRADVELVSAINYQSRRCRRSNDSRRWTCSVCAGRARERKHPINSGPMDRMRLHLL